MKITAIILAAGKGRRMNSKKCKQYMDLSGKPVLYYSLSAFSNSKVNEIIVVTGADDISYCRNNIVDKYDFTKVTSIIEGGNERYESVYNALKCVQTDYV
ncbi:MAG: 2-C-methyl-D-erythritol 4-phosphate cytidylyltransferase, partial [Eubacterium sp.]